MLEKKNIKQCLDKCCAGGAALFFLANTCFVVAAVVVVVKCFFFRLTLVSLSLSLVGIKRKYLFTIGPAEHRRAKGSTTSSKCWRGRRWWETDTWRRGRSARSGSAAGRSWTRPRLIVSGSGSSSRPGARAWPSSTPAWRRCRRPCPPRRPASTAGDAACASECDAGPRRCCRSPSSPATVWATAGTRTVAWARSAAAGTATPSLTPPASCKASLRSAAAAAGDGGLDSRDTPGWMSGRGWRDRAGTWSWDPSQRLARWSSSTRRSAKLDAEAWSRFRFRGHFRHFRISTRSSLSLSSIWALSRGSVLVQAHFRSGSGFPSMPVSHSSGWFFSFPACQSEIKRKGLPSPKIQQESTYREGPAKDMTSCLGKNDPKHKEWGASCWTIWTIKLPCLIITMSSINSLWINDLIFNSGLLCSSPINRRRSNKTN